MAIIKAGPEPLEDLSAFLKPFGSLVRRAESREALKRYTTWLLADLPRKTASGMVKSYTVTGKVIRTGHNKERCAPDPGSMPGSSRACPEPAEGGVRSNSQTSRGGWDETVRCQQSLRTSRSR